MGSREMPLKVIKVLMLDLTKQGCTVKETKSGYMIFFPNGDSTSLHKTPSDVRVVKNIRSNVRRAGLTWMLDGKKAS